MYLFIVKPTYVGTSLTMHITYTIITYLCSNRKDTSKVFYSIIRSLIFVFIALEIIRKTL